MNEIIRILKGLYRAYRENPGMPIPANRKGRRNRIPPQGGRYGIRYLIITGTQIG